MGFSDLIVILVSGNVTSGFEEVKNVYIGGMKAYKYQQIPNLV